MSHPFSGMQVYTYETHSACVLHDKNSLKIYINITFLKQVIWDNQGCSFTCRQN